MRFVYYGNFLAPYCSENHFKKSLESLGHKILPLQENKITTDEVLSESLKADALIWSHSHSYYPEGRRMSEVLAKLRQKGIPTIAYHLDLFMGIPDRWQRYQYDDYFRVRYFFTPDRQLARWLTANRNTGYYLPAGVLEEECISVTPANEVQPIVFIGSKLYHRQWPYRPTLINWLHKNYGDDFGHYGNDGLRPIRGLELNSVLHGAKVVIGDSFSPNYDYPYYWSDRVYETTGRGGFMIHPMIAGLEDNFVLGKEIETYEFKNSAQLKEKIDYYLAHDNQREAIRRAGTDRTKKDHTYKARWKHILETIR